jgi:hypothetical protein
MSAAVVRGPLISSVTEHNAFGPQTTMVNRAESKTKLLAPFRVFQSLEMDKTRTTPGQAIVFLSRLFGVLQPLPCGIARTQNV